MKMLLKNKYFVLLLIIAFVFLPSAFSKESQGETEAIVVAIGIDKSNEEYEVSVQTIVPTPAEQYNQNINLVTDKGKDIASAFNLIELRMGKPIGLVHCKTIVLNDTVCEENVTKLLECISRTKVNTNNISLIHTNSKAKDFLKASGDINSALFSVISDNNYNKKGVYTMNTSLGDYFNEYLSQAKCSMLSSIDLKKESEIGGLGEQFSISNQNSQGGAQASSGTGDKEVLYCEGNSVILLGGRRVKKLTRDETESVNWAKSQEGRGLLLIENVTDEMYNNATISLSIERKITKPKVYFENGIPTVEISVIAISRMIEISQEEETEAQLTSTKKFLTKELKRLAEQKITEMLNNSYQISKETNADILGLMELFYKYKTKEYKKFIADNGIENFISSINFKTKVTIKERD